MTAQQQDQEQPSSYAWCNWHKGYSGTARLVQAIEQGSGFGGDLFACKECRGMYGLVPIADQP